MERIRIDNVEQKTTSAGKDMWKVTYNDNLTFNLFDNKAQEAWYLNENKGKDVDCSFEMSKCGKFKNLKEVMITNPSHEAREGTPLPGMPSTEVPTSVHEKVAQIPMSTRDELIVAQVCLKGAVELAKGQLAPGAIANNEILGEFLCMAVVELTSAYKVALKQLA